MAVNPLGGYWMVAADGGVFSFGNAAFWGSLGGVPISYPIIDMANTPSGLGYYFVSTSGRIFTFGDAAFEGSAT